jgi:hypothetical protein
LRQAVRQVDDNNCTEPVVTGDPWTKEEIIAAQRNDSEIGAIYRALEESNTKPDSQTITLWSGPSKTLVHYWPRLSIRNGVLYRRFEDPDGIRSTWQIVVPETYLPEKYRQQIIERAHSGMTGGHLGRKKTESQISRRAYWPTWKTDVQLLIEEMYPLCPVSPGITAQTGVPKPISGWVPMGNSVNGHHRTASTVTGRERVYPYRSRLVHKVGRGDTHSEPHGTNSGPKARGSRVFSFRRPFTVIV